MKYIDFHKRAALVQQIDKYIPEITEPIGMWRIVFGTNENKRMNSAARNSLVSKMLELRGWRNSPVGTGTVIKDNKVMGNLVALQHYVLQGAPYSLLFGEVR